MGFLGSAKAPVYLSVRTEIKVLCMSARERERERGGGGACCVQGQIEL